MEMTGTELQTLRARQMRALAKDGRITAIIPKLVLTVLESITITGNGQFDVRFLDGTGFIVR